MQLRFRSDRRTLLWAFVLFPLVPAIAYLEPRSLWLVAPFTLYLSYCAGVLTHNQTHCPVFVGRRMNLAYGLWLSLFYGCPSFVWIPTHLANHHRYLNGEGDVTRTTRHALVDTPLAALTYPLRATRYQWPLILAYVAAARKSGGVRLTRVVSETLVVVLGHATLCALGVWLHGLGPGALVYALAFGLPAALAPYWMMLTNYLQHVNCQPDSAHGHSRNFVNPWFNWLAFDNGYHTVHHEQPGLHWSLAKAEHLASVWGIEPHLNHDSPLTYCLAEYGRWSEKEARMADPVANCSKAPRLEN